MYYVYRYKKTGEMPAGLQRGGTRVSGLALPTPSRPGTSSHITFNHGVNPSSMVPSGISGTSRVSSLSQSDYGNQSPGRFGSFRLTKASQNRSSSRDIAGLSPRNASNAGPPSFSRPETSSLALSSQQESPSLSKALMVSHTGIPSPPLGMDSPKPDRTSPTLVTEVSRQSIESLTVSPSKAADSVPTPPLVDSSVSNSQESSDRRPRTGLVGTGVAPLPSEQEAKSTERNTEGEKNDN
jgi:hypothetical protein